MASILIVTTDSSLAITLRLLCEINHHETDHVTEAHVASALASTGAFDLVFVDFELPWHESSELIEAIRSDTRTTATRIIALTAGEKRRTSSAESGADRVIARPFKASFLCQVLAELLASEGLGVGTSATRSIAGLRVVFLTE